MYNSRQLIFCRSCCGHAQMPKPDQHAARFARIGRLCPALDHVHVQAQRVGRAITTADDRKASKAVVKRKPPAKAKPMGAFYIGDEVRGPSA